MNGVNFGSVRHDIVPCHAGLDPASMTSWIAGQARNDKNEGQARNDKSEGQARNDNTLRSN
jgi:hypothetical protein